MQSQWDLTITNHMHRGSPAWVQSKWIPERSLRIITKLSKGGVKEQYLNNWLLQLKLGKH